MTGTRVDEIRGSEAALKRLRPFCADIIGFYARVFEAQEESAAALDLEAPSLSEEAIALRIGKKLPLLTPCDFPIDAESAVRLMRTICGIGEAAKGGPAVYAPLIRVGLDNEAIDPKELFSAVAGARASAMEDAAARAGVRPEVLRFFAFSGMIPSLRVSAEALSRHLPPDAPHEKGGCPICGNPPSFSLLTRERARILICGFCRHPWLSPRIFCPYCETRDPERLSYFFAEGEKDCRVYICGRCNRYLKTVDARETDRLIYPPLEEAAMIHLELKARMANFRSGEESMEYDPGQGDSDEKR